MSFIDELFADMRSAPMTNRGGYMDDGIYKVQIKGMFVKKSQNPKKAGAKVFVCEFTVLESNNDKHKPGSSGSWASQFDAFGYTVSDIKRLMFAAMGLDPKDESSHVLVELCTKAVCDSSSPAVALLKAPPYEIDDANALVLGSVVGLEVKRGEPKPGQEKGFARYYWSEATDKAAA